jgi:hypothetical protein
VDVTPVSANFSLEELTFSEVALRKGLNNDPDDEVKINLSRLATLLLEPARDILKVPLHINSGYRSRKVNTAVGGAKNSAHMRGLAADIVPIGVPLLNAFNALRTNLKGWDQAIVECQTWIHLSIPEAGEDPRGEALVASGGPGNWKYLPADMFA